MSSEEMERQTSSQHPIKVVIAKPGLDGHDRGAKVVARALRDAGMEVVYTGIFQTPGVDPARRDPRGRRTCSACRACPARTWSTPWSCARCSRRTTLEDVLFLVGGTIPDDDAEQLRAVGVAGVFGPGTHTDEIIKFIEQRVVPRTGA